ncbi:type II toxin-antitoxin system RelE/ParE family toxin [Nocardia sp. NPDC058705]|uniref:type II toxin-antitoxin system RelE/ParE family toxin n=1 Tax=Nocardia sp. NPDC058705 TaxID=3346609 RepID=UPI003691181A
MALFEIYAEPEVVEWLRSLTPAQLARVDEVVGLLAEEGTSLGMPLSRSLGDRVWELRIHLHPIEMRLTYWFASNNRVVMLTTFRKTRDNERLQVMRAKEAQKLCSVNHDIDKVVAFVDTAREVE